MQWVVVHSTRGRPVFVEGPYATRRDARSIECDDGDGCQKAVVWLVRTMTPREVEAWLATVPHRAEQPAPVEQP